MISRSDTNRISINNLNTVQIMKNICTIILTALAFAACSSTTTETPEVEVMITDVSISLEGDSYLYFNEGYAEIKISVAYGDVHIYLYIDDKLIDYYNLGEDCDVLNAQPGDTICFDKEQFEVKAIGTPVATIVSSYTTAEAGVRYLILDNGHEVKITCGRAGYSDYVDILDRNGKSLYWFRRSSHNELFHQWQKAKVGDNLSYTVCDGKIFYKVNISPDYTRERVVKKVTKYDGSMSKIDGSISISGGMFYASGSGSIHGEARGSQNFFINLYFEEGDPVSVCAKDNPLFLDIEAGDTIIERSINGVVSYSPKFN